MCVTWQLMIMEIFFFILCNYIFNFAIERLTLQFYCKLLCLGAAWSAFFFFFSFSLYLLEYELKMACTFLTLASEVSLISCCGPFGVWAH